MPKNLNIGKPKRQPGRPKKKVLGRKPGRPRKVKSELQIISDNFEGTKPPCPPKPELTLEDAFRVLMIDIAIMNNYLALLPIHLGEIRDELKTLNAQIEDVRNGRAHFYVRER